MLVKSLIRIVYPKAELEDTTVILDVNGNKFKATGSIITNNGWYAVDAMPDKKATLPPINEGESYPGKYSLKQGFTEPPKRYTEPDLITAMETAGKNIEDEEARSLMKLENKGLGTAATRAAIVNALFARNYLAKKGKTIYPTEKGIFIIDNLPVDELKSAELTGLWEKRLHEISVGNEEDYDGFVSDIEQTVRDWYGIIANSDNEAYTSDIEKISCPFCSGNIIKGKFGYVCSNRRKTGCSFAVGSEICGKKISEEQFIKLVQKGKTSLIRGFVKKNSDKEFDAYLVLDKFEQKIKFEFPEKLKCPVCGEIMLKGKYGYFCSGKKEAGCNFSVPSEFCGKKLSAAQMEKLINDGKTSLISGFKKKDSDKEFDAYLVLDKFEQKIKFEFPERLKCPICRKTMLKGKYGYFCSGKKESGCNFSVGSEICGKSISDVQARRLIEKGKTALIKGFKNKSGKEFDAYLVADKKQGKIGFEFPPQNKVKH